MFPFFRDFENKESFEILIIKNSVYSQNNQLWSVSSQCPLYESKILDEINELIEAVNKDSNKIHEAADVFYHLIMYLEANNIKIEDVIEELNKRKK